MKKNLLLIIFGAHISWVTASPVNFLRCKESVDATMLTRSQNYNNVSQNFRDFIKNTNSNISIVIVLSHIFLNDAEYVADAYVQISTMLNLYDAKKIDGVKNKEITMSFLQPNFVLIKKKSKDIGEKMEYIRDKALFREAMQFKIELDKDLDAFKYCYQ